MKDNLFKIVLIAEFILLIFVGVYFFEGNDFVASISTLQKEDLITSNSSSSLDYFYELRPGERELKKPEWLSYTPKISVNKDTLNERFNYNLKKDEDVFRIVTLGDSWVYGMYVSTPDNFSEKMEDSLNKLECKDINKFEVINLGVPSYDIKYSVERFKKRGKKYDPDLVILNLLPNDFSEVTEFLKQRSDKYRKSGYLDEKSSENEWDMKKAETRNSFLVWKQALKDQKEEYGKSGALDYQAKALEGLSDESDTLLLYNLEKVMPLSSDQKKVVQNLIDSDSDSYFYESKLKLSEGKGLLPDYHPSPKGHKMIADDLIGYIAQKSLFRCENRL